MVKSALAGKAQTVLGAIEGKYLGITLSHEHLFADLRSYFVEPSRAEDKATAYKPVSLETLSWVRYHPFENLDNLQLSIEREAIEEVMTFKKAGGGTIVDVSNVGLARNPKGLVHVSKATGLNIIMGAGYYVGVSHPPGMSTKTEGEITEEIVRDIVVGVGDTGIHAGIIGEIGCTWPLEDNERKVLRAAARAQQRTGAPIGVHIGRKTGAALEIIDVLDDAGADLKRTIIAHADNRVRDQNERRKLAKTGCYLEYDTFGVEGHVGFYEYYVGDLFYQPNDPQRILEIMQLIEEGYLNQILVSHDICLKTWRVQYGGQGYAHICSRVVPKMLRAGITQEQVDVILVENPKRLLCFV